MNHFRQFLDNRDRKKANEKSTAYIKENLSPLLTDYFALLEKDFDDKISAQKMLKMASCLPLSFDVETSMKPYFLMMLFYPAGQHQ